MSSVEPDITGQSYKIRSIYELSPQALGELRSYMESSGFQLPISQVVGFTQFNANFAITSAAMQGTSSTTYTDLSTVGPTIDSLPSGRYLVFVISGISSSNTVYAGYMSPSVNGATPSDADGAYASTASLTKVVSVSAHTLDLDVNTITAKYKSADAGTTVYFQDRQMIALRYANR